MSSILPGIEHIVVLMMENRSFDNILGDMVPNSSNGGGLSGTEYNLTNPSDPNSQKIKVWKNPSSGQEIFTMPFPDPGESFDQMNQQIFAPNSSSGSETMGGFVYNYANIANVQTDSTDIMHYYRSSDLPVTSALVQNYAVCDQWFASAPNQTYPNRVFTHCATPGTYNDNGNIVAYLNDSDYIHGFPVSSPSVFGLLDKKFGFGQANWKVYFNDFPISLLVQDVLVAAAEEIIFDRKKPESRNVIHYGSSSESPKLKIDEFSSSDPSPTFAEDVLNDSLPPYSFIEPRYTNIGGSGNSNHPGGSEITLGPFHIFGHTFGPYVFETPKISVANGEAFLQNVYDSLAANPEVFKKTLLIITYDEHGGTYDHVCPPPATSPFQSGSVTGFDFNRFGVRVPTLLINPYIKANSIFAPPAGGSPFDHTTIISTLNAQFDLGFSLTPRDAAAPTLEGIINTGQDPHIANISGIKP